MCFIVLRFVVLLLLCGVLQVATQGSDEYVRFCYYPSSAWNTRQLSAMKLSACTHLLYAFVPFDDSTGAVQLTEADREMIPKMMTEVSKYPNLKVILSTGGWTVDPSRFTKLSQNRRKRLQFAVTAFQLIKQYGMHGFDIDWEFPNYPKNDERGHGEPTDKDTFLDLVQTLFTTFTRMSNGVGSSRPLITLAVSADVTRLTDMYNFNMSQYIDYYLIMSYDFATYPSKKTLEMQSGLYARRNDPTPLHNINATVLGYKEHVARSKLVIGIPLYGRTFQFSDKDKHHPGDPSLGRGQKYLTSGESGVRWYSETCRESLLFGHGTREWSGDQQVPYIWGFRPGLGFEDFEWLTYEDPKSVFLKAKFAMEQGLAGTMVWSIDQDDYLGYCQLGKSPLLSAIQAAHERTITDVDDVKITQKQDLATPPPQTPSTTTDTQNTETPTPDGTARPTADPGSTPGPGRTPGSGFTSGPGRTPDVRETVQSTNSPPAGNMTCVNCTTAVLTSLRTTPTPEPLAVTRAPLTRKELKEIGIIVAGIVGLIIVALLAIRCYVRYNARTVIGNNSWRTRLKRRLLRKANSSNDLI